MALYIDDILVTTDPKTEEEREMLRYVVNCTGCTRLWDEKKLGSLEKEENKEEK